MTMTAITGFAYLPAIPADVATSPTLSGTTLDANGESMAFIVDVPKTGNIRKVIWRTGSCNGTNTIDVRLETLDRTATPAIPSGTLWGTNTNGSQSVINSDDNVIFATQLTADAAVTQGDPIAVVINMSSVGTSVIVLGFTDDKTLSYPYSLTNTSGSYVFLSAGPVLAFEYDDGSITPIVGCALPLAHTATTFDSSSTPNSYAQRIVLPAPMRCAGFWVWGDIDGDTTVKLVSSTYNQGAGTGILASMTLNNEDRAADAINVTQRMLNADVDLDANTTYRLVFEPGVTGISIYDRSFTTLNQMNAETPGQNACLSTAKDPTQDSDWTNYNNGTFRSLYCGLLLRGFSDGAGGGGMIVHPGMNGGLRG